MPLYEYECPACQKVHEVMQKFSDAPMAECPECKGPVSKLISMSSFALKGSGWYTTDYKSKSGPAVTPANAATPTPPPTSAPAASPASTSTPASGSTSSGSSTGSGTSSST